jgi:hypothetical protein
MTINTSDAEIKRMAHLLMDGNLPRTEIKKMVSLLDERSEGDKLTEPKIEQLASLLELLALELLAQ